MRKTKRKLSVNEAKFDPKSATKTHILLKMKRTLGRNGGGERG
jgi:hypothetical protein